jgi:transketolase
VNNQILPNLEQRAVNTIRFLSVDAVQKANSGHPGLPMGMAQAAYTLWTKHLRFNPKNPYWFGRDRFVLSAGHGSMLLYSLLHLSGYDISLDDIKNFRQRGSKTPGHPEYNIANGIETTTGPLGQGFANGVGMALAANFLEARFNKPDLPIINYNIYALVSDGDLMEGISSEAASLAGHLGLGRLIYLYDDNGITLDTDANQSYTENWKKRFEAYGWHVQSIDGMKGKDVSEAIVKAQKDSRPSIIGCKTIIGYGSPHKQGTSKAHGEPLGEEEVVLTKKNLGWPEDKTFYVPEDVRNYFKKLSKKGEQLEKEHNQLLKKYKTKYPHESQELNLFLQNKLPDGWKSNLPTFTSGNMATRAASGEVINNLSESLKNLIGGSADLAGSNKTTINADGFIQKNTYSHRNIRFGVREHAMAGILNGMAVNGGVIPFGATFLTFSDYLRGSMRLTALMGIRVIYVFTHDSIGLGEDGPTHQPIEHLASLRAIPNLMVIRPGDANEVPFAWQAAIENTKGPTALILTRQDLPVYDRKKEKLGNAKELLKGGYVFYESEKKPDCLLIATGSELSIAYEAAKELERKRIPVRVVSFPCWELFKKQDYHYQQSLLPEGLPKISIEAGSSFGWERWVGNDPKKGLSISINRFGASAPASQLFKEFGFTVENVISKVKQLLK